jgi:glycosyltransferase involved in cell wall biosynthesis
MKFSLVIPTYNRADAVCKAIRSALAQTEEDFEIIVIDDGSTDNTKEMVKAITDPRVLYYYKANEERGAARNFGTQKAKGGYVSFLDSDDILYSNYFANAAQVIVRYNSPEVFHLGYEVKDEKGELLWDVSYTMLSANRVLIKGNLLSCAGVFIRNDIAKANLFNEDRSLAGLEDWELWLRLASKYTIYMDRRVSSCIINHEGRSVLDINKDKLVARIKIFIKCVTSNSDIVKYYGSNGMRDFNASCYTYCALHLAMAKYKSEAWPYLRKGIIISPKNLFSKRFAVTIKHLLF